MSFKDELFIVFGGIFIYCIINLIFGISKDRKKAREREKLLSSFRISDEEMAFADKADKLYEKGFTVNSTRAVREALSEYELLHKDISSKQELVHESYYQQEIQDLRDSYELMCIDEWHEKAERILDDFYEIYELITEPSFDTVDKAYRSKKRCLKRWEAYFSSVPSDTGVWYDEKNYIKEYLDEVYDDCMSSYDALEEKLSKCIDDMKPEYKRKMKLRSQVLDVVETHEGIMRAKLVSMPFDGFTKIEVELCVKGLVNDRRLVAVKTNNRYYVSLSDKEKNKRLSRSTAVQHTDQGIDSEDSAPPTKK